jgi:hypothetical protein
MSKSEVESMGAKVEESEGVVGCGRLSKGGNVSTDEEMMAWWLEP